MNEMLTGLGDNPFDVTVASLSSAGKKERQGHCGNSQTTTLLLLTQSVDKADQHREAY